MSTIGKSIAKKPISYLYGMPKSPWITETIGQRLETFARKQPEREAYVFRLPNKPRQAVTWSDLYDRSGKLCSVLVNHGFQVGDRALIYGPSTAEYIEADTALARAGIAPIRQAQSILDLHTMVDVINRHRSSALALHPGSDGEYITEVRRLFPDLLTDLQSDGQIKSSLCPTLKRVYALGTHEDLPVATTSSLIENVPTDWANVTSERAQLVDCEDTCVVLLTSGSTGKPKSIPWSHWGILNNMKALSETVGITSESRFFNDRPFSWIGSFSQIPMAMGNTNVFLQVSATLLDRNSDYVSKVLSEERCTNGWIMKYLLHDLGHWMQEGRIKLPDLQQCVIGGEVLDGPLLELVTKYIPTVYNGYGQSELGFISTGRVINDYESIGTPIPGTEVRIVEDGRALPEGEYGEIYVRSPCNFWGYLDNEALTAECQTAQRWWKTGDTGLIKNNTLYFKARKHEMISYGARKIAPNEIESQVASHPAVEAVCAMGLPDTRMGELICACVVVKEGHTLTEDDVIGHALGSAKNHQSGLEYPISRVVFVEKLPLTRTGKVNRKLLKEQVLEMNLT